MLGAMLQPMPSAALGGIGGKLGRIWLAALERRARPLAIWSFAAHAHVLAAQGVA